MVTQNETPTQNQPQEVDFFQVAMTGVIGQILSLTGSNGGNPVRGAGTTSVDMLKSLCNTGISLIEAQGKAYSTQIANTEAAARLEFAVKQMNAQLEQLGILGRQPRVPTPPTEESSEEDKVLVFRRVEDAIEQANESDDSDDLQSS